LGKNHKLTNEEVNKFANLINNTNNTTPRSQIARVIQGEAAKEARQANKGARARQAAIPKGPVKNWRTYKAPNFDPELVYGLVAVIKGAVKPSVAVPILKAAGPNPVAAAVNKVNGNVPKNIAPIAAGVISNGNQSEAPIARALNTLGPEAGPPPIESTPRDPEAIGDVYYAGKKVGYAFGTATRPTFRRRRTSNKIPEWHGWYLEPAAGLENVPRFEFMHKNYPAIASVTSNITRMVTNAIQESAPKNVATGLVSMITGAVPVAQTRIVAMTTRPVNMPAKIANVGKNVSNIVTNVIKPLPLTPTQKAAIKREPWKLPAFGSFKLPAVGSFKLPVLGGFGKPFKRPVFGGSARKTSNELPPGSFFVTPSMAASPVYTNNNANRLANNALSNENKTELASAPVAQQAAIRKNLFEMFKGLYVRSPGGKWTFPRLTEEQKKQIQNAFHSLFNRKPSPTLANRVFGRKTKPQNQRPNNRQTPEPTNSIFKRLFAGLFPPAKKVVKQTQNVHNKPGNKRRLDALEKALKELKEALKNSKQAPVVNEFIHKYYPAPVLKGNKPVPEPAIINRELHKIVGPGNYSKINIEVLFKKRGNKNGPSNSDLLSRLEQEIKSLNGLSSAERHRRLGELLKMVPMNFPGRGKLVTAVLAEIRSISRNRNPSDAQRRLANMKSNLKLAYTNKEIMESLALENKRATNNLRQNVGIGRRRGETNTEYSRRLANTSRKSYETNANYERRIRRTSRLPGENTRNYQRRMETFSRRRGESNQNYNKRVAIENRRQEIRRMEINRRRRLRGGLNLPPSPANANIPANLPPIEQKALENVGGAERAANIISQVPGGIPAVAKAAQSVNEVGHQNAVVVHDNHPMAVEAVKKLGGHNNTIHVLEGLKKTMMRRRRPGAKKPRGPRKAVLNELLKETRKVNLAPVVARMVTKTGKVKQTLRTYKKNYNKKLIKSAIFRTRAANIAKNAAKKK
jgi:hypothetical protein